VSEAGGGVSDGIGQDGGHGVGVHGGDIAILGRLCKLSRSPNGCASTSHRGVELSWRCSLFARATTLRTMATYFRRPGPTTGQAKDECKKDERKHERIA
jgi:hypothetical protein